jgi:hypothetical protein
MASMNAHQGRRGGGAWGGGSGSGTVSDCVSITEVTTAAGWIAGLAIVALIATGWRKTARATANPARARRPDRAPTGVEVVTVDTPMDHHAHTLKRVWSVVAASALAVWVGAIVATVLGFGVAYAVITLTHMLKR